MTTAGDSDSESQFSVPKSDAGGSDSDAEGKKKSPKTNESGIPRLPELEPPDIMVSEFSRMSSYTGSRL